eukprot:7572366-Alexandrium_andersonii.AAC.1
MPANVHRPKDNPFFGRENPASNRRMQDIAVLGTLNPNSALSINACGWKRLQAPERATFGLLHFAVLGRIALA